MTGIPLATVADPAQVEAVRPYLQGRRCVIVGSAPLSSRYADVAVDEIAVPVNGAISSCSDSPPLWVVASKAQDQPGNVFLRPLHRHMLHQSKGRRVGHILLLRGPKVASEAMTLRALSLLDCRYASWSVLDKPTKLWIETEWCARKPKEPCSSGILAAAIALTCGAESVRLVGMSLKPGYHYLPHEKPQSWWRDHIQSDTRALIALRARYGEKLSGDLVEAVAA